MNQLVRKSLQKIREEQEKIRNEMRERTISYVAGALGLVAGLAWNDAIRTVIEYFFPVKSQSIPAKLIYAVLITFVIVFITVYLMRFSKQQEK